MRPSTVALLAVMSCTPSPSGAPGERAGDPQRSADRQRRSPADGADARQRPRRPPRRFPPRPSISARRPA